MQQSPSTLADLRIWTHAVATGTLLEPETQRQRLQTVSMTHDGAADPNNYGLGIFNASGWIGHSGSLPGYQSVGAYLPQAQTTLVVLLNTDAPRDGSNPSTVLTNAITGVISPENVYVASGSPPGPEGGLTGPV